LKDKKNNFRPGAFTELIKEHINGRANPSCRLSVRSLVFDLKEQCHVTVCLYCVYWTHFSSPPAQMSTRKVGLSAGPFTLRLALLCLKVWTDMNDRGDKAGEMTCALTEYLKVYHSIFNSALFAPPLPKLATSPLRTPRSIVPEANTTSGTTCNRIAV